MHLWEKNLGVLHSVDSGKSETGWAFMRFDVFSVADRALPTPTANQMGDVMYTGVPCLSICPSVVWHPHIFGNSPLGVLNTAPPDLGVPYVTVGVLM